VILVLLSCRPQNFFRGPFQLQGLAAVGPLERYVFDIAELCSVATRECGGDAVATLRESLNHPISPSGESQVKGRNPRRTFVPGDAPGEAALAAADRNDAGAGRLFWLCPQMRQHGAEA